MAVVADMIELPISEQDLKDAVAKALAVDFTDNLRKRAPFVKLDSKIRGYLGEIGMQRFLNENGITIVATDSGDENGEDRDITVSNGLKEAVLEVKTSLIPDLWGTIDKVFENADIKVIKRESDYHDVKADFHLQILFNQLRKGRDTFLKSIPGKPQDYDVKKIIEIMGLKQLRQWFAAWMSKPGLIAYLDKATEKTWHYSYKYFWKCPLAVSKAPAQLPDAIKKFK